MTPADQLYNDGLMAGRLNTREAPPFGQRMATLRRRKGFTQTQLAGRMNTTQKMIDYYERRSPNPTLDVMQKIAAALEISVTELLGEDAVAVRKARTNGPVGKVREVFDRVPKLPRRRQEHIVNWVSAYVSHYEQSRQN